MALREADDEGSQLTALHELCEMLAVSTEESLSVFPVDQLIPILVRFPFTVHPSLARLCMCNMHEDVTHKHLHPLCEASAVCASQVNLLQAEHNADMMLLAARGLTFLADVMPASAASIVRHGAVQVGPALENWLNKLHQ